ncbi:uncharacterized protein [Miscanthus floridulus]|uniref:uncharacterized protein n=1 Tax=Miscanthus floridulus TaxID=154761 RepID=UPI00345B494C
MLDAHNPLARQFILAKDRLAENGDEEFIIRIIGAREGDPVQYNLPTIDQLAMLVVGDFSLDTYQRDIVVQARSGHLQQISSLHSAFMALQYPLLFPYGERGYQTGVVYNANQSKLRVESLQGIVDAVDRGVYGPPDFFTTFTCNPKWPEISEALEPGKKPTDRADIVVRVYNMKLEELLDDIRSGSAFGAVSAERWPVHLPDDNCVVYDTDTDIADVASEEFLRKTMLTEWFVANQNADQGRHLTYCEFPSKWKWDSSSRSWDCRQRPTGKIGRLYYVHPSVGERYFLRMLLLVVRGAQSYEDVRRYNGVLYPTFKLACSARGLLGDDKEWYDAFDEAAAWATSSQLRKLFVTMLLFCEVNDKYTFFEKVWRPLADDIQYRFRELVGYQVPDIELRNHLLDELSSLFSRNWARMRDHNLPEMTTHLESASGNRLIQEELSYCTDQLMGEAENLISMLNEQQLIAFKSITETVLNDRPGFFFVSGYGGTGKTFLWGGVVAWIRAHQKIVLTVASSGVAALLLPAGRTAHSPFKIPCDLDDDSVCDIKHGSMLGELIESASLIIWDEALMTHRHAFEALDRTFRDLLSHGTEGAEGLVFGGKVVVLGGDLRQILPVVEGGGRAEIVNAAIVNSPLWKQRCAMAFDLLPALRPRAWRSVICVRVCRKWEYRGGTDDGLIQHVDLVLVDDKGNSMYGEIPGSEVVAKSPLIEEGGIYVISRFRVSNTKSGYRPVASRYMVEFTLHTVVSAARTDMPDFPKDFVDTTGLLVEKSDAYTVHLPNKPAPTLTRHIVLRDLSYSEMKVTLWGEGAAAFNTDAVNNGAEDKPIVVLFVGGLMKSYQVIRTREFRSGLFLHQWSSKVKFKRLPLLKRKLYEN